MTSLRQGSGLAGQSDAGVEEIDEPPARQIAWADERAIEVRRSVSVFQRARRDTEIVNRVCLARWAGSGGVCARKHDHGEHLLGYDRERWGLLVAGSDYGGE